MPNRLAAESSSHLRAHAGDPVEWRSWDADALAEARALRRPILLSVGYAACHGCRAMARGCFADPAIGALINREFLPILVDREEHPDVDRCYQLAHQALQKRPGGWPLTAFLDPDDLLPFFIGTYFPPQRAHGLPGFADVLGGLARWFRECPEERAEQARALDAFLSGHGRHPPERGELHAGPWQSACASWRADAEGVREGARGAPAFPRPTALALALDGDDPGLAAQARIELSAMAAGGLQDQLGGGFFRCSIDAAWQVPQFEKALADNARLLPLYARLAAEGDAEARRAATGIVSWLESEMPRREGGFAATLGSAGGGGGGDFYLWQRETFDPLVPEAERGWLARHFGLDGPPNVEGGHWHLRIATPLTELSAELGVEEKALRERRKGLVRRLQLARARRAAPQHDGICIAAGNGLLLSGLARAALWLDREDWADAATRLASDLQRLLWRDGRLHAFAHGDTPGRSGFLDDHAALLLGLLDLLECRFDAQWLDWASELAERLLSDFEDADQGGFWFSAHGGDALPHRGKPFVDEATPAGNGMAALALLRLGALLVEPRYRQAAERCLRAGWESLALLPESCATMLAAWREWRQPAPLLIARLGDVNEASRWNDVLKGAARRGCRVLRVSSEVGMLPEALEDKRWLRGGRVYWCEGLRCLPRFDSPVALQARLEALHGAAQGDG